MDNHTWNVSPKEARTIQEEVRNRVILRPLRKTPALIAGADVSMNRFDTDLYAGIVVLTYPGLEIIETSLIKEKITFSYVPGLLSFREIPSLIKAYEKLRTKPDLIFVDGHGIAHPRRLGIASHLGVVLEISTIGCAKSLLIGSIKDDRIIDKGEIIGAVVHSKKNSNPLYISPGHLITLNEAVEYVSATLRGYRLPEPTRIAHNTVNKFRRGEIEM